MDNYGYSVLPQQGWQCPICGRILSPITPFCPCYEQGRTTATTTTTTADNVTTGGEENGEITATNTLEYYIKNVFPNLPFPKEREK